MLSRRHIVPAYVAAVLVAVAIFASQIVANYDQQLLNARSTTDNLARFMQQQLDATLRRTDSTLEDLVRSARAESLYTEVRANYESGINSALAARRVKFPEIAAFRLIDAAGNLLYTSDPVKNFANLSDRPYFREMRDNAAAGLVFSDVQVSRFTGQTVVVAGRGIHDGTGRFLGAGIAVIDLAVYAKLFDSIDLGPQGLISIRRTDSRLVLRKPNDPALINQPIANPIHDLISQGQAEGTIRHSAATDGIDRVFSFRRVPDYPFYFTIGLAAEDVLAGWQRQAIVASVMALLSLAVITSLLCVLSRAYVREGRSFRDLQEREQNLRYVLEATGEGIWDWNVAAQTVRVNARFCELLGIAGQRTEFTTDALRAHAVPDDQLIYRKALLDCLKGTSSLQAECRLRRENGAIIWVLIRGDVVERDEAGRAARMVGSIADITQRQLAAAQLARSQLELQTIIDNEPDCVNLVSADGALLKMNRAGLAMVDARDFEEVAGKPFQSFLLPECQDAFVALTRRVFGGESGSLEFEIVGLTGVRRWLAMHAVPLPDTGGNIRAALGVTRDVTARKSDEIRLREAVQAAQAANIAKSAFIATISHEIRTPMNGILGMTELALDTELTAEQREFLLVVKASSEQLLSVISDVLDFSRLEAGKVGIDESPFGIRKVIEAAREALSSRAQEKGLELVAEVATGVASMVVGDPGRLRQILLNLVGNAVKFTERGRVAVRAEAESYESGGLVLHFTVSDTGIGIPAAKQASIFEPFSQEDSSVTRKHGGTGLGLTISARLVAMMGGRIWVVSEPGHGSVFHFTVRFRNFAGQAGTRPPPDATVASPDAGPMDILVVEDHQVNQNLVLTMIGRRGHRATLARDGREATDILAARRFDLVLMDMQMPVMDGLEATRRFRAHETGTRTPIVAMTASAMAGDREACLAAGMDDYLSKPLRASELTAILARYAPVRKQERVFDYAAALANEDQEIVGIVAAPFIESFPGDVKAMRNALAGNDIAALRRAAHTIKGSCGMFGAKPMVEIARTIELHDPTREANLDIGALIDMLEADFGRLAGAIRECGG